uniref:Nuclear export mediator factor NEMF n=1 Tax=Schistocephalus solidus TaxID=70667 RepID=A0A0X3NZ65_SCHSO
MKGGFEGFDVVATVGELQRTLVGCRLVNAYDSNNKIYMLKFACTSDDSKPVLLLESGVRLHLTSFSWPKGMMPLGFTMKLRKHIKNKKLASIRQLGVDRLVDLQFGFDEYAYHLIVELYGKGNIFLTDAEYMILHLLRPRTDVNQDVRYAAHQKYPVELARPVPQCLLNLEEESSVKALTEEVSQLLVSASGPWNTDGAELVPAVTALSTVLPFGTGFLEHCCCVAGLMGSKKQRKGVKTSGDSTLQKSPAEAEACRLEYSQRLARELRLCLLRAYHSSSVDASPPPAVIIGNPDPKEPGKLSKYDVFHPFRFAQFATRAAIEFPTFNQAVDEFFSSLESQRTEVQIVQNEKKASKRLDNVRKDQEQRLKKLQEEQVLDNRKAELLELNADLVDKVLYALNYALANQTSWTVIETAVAEQKARGDPVSSCIERLQLDLNQAVLRLNDPYVNDDDEDEEKEEEKGDTEESLEVTVDLGCNALQNAKRYYDHRRLAHDKEKKTITGTKRALKAASKKAEKTKTQVHGVQRISKTREPFWFEKFHWFISSDNYLVLAGRDAGQNENLIKRYFKPQDIYVHADVHGASSVIVKARPLQPNEPPDPSGNPLPVPPMRTLIEAGHMAVTLSNAWTAKVITNAWWVRHDQVSKTAPSGEYLKTGSFVIRGRKNLLPQCHLIYGFSVLFVLADDSLERHRGERCIDAEGAADVDASLRKYECISFPEPTKGEGEAGGETHDSADELTHALDDVSLKLNINRSTRTTQCKPNLTSKNKPKRQPTSKPNETESIAEKPQGENRSSTNEKKRQDGVLKRGQKAKAKRIKEKYADQDEEERKLCLFLLQGASAKPSALHSLGQPKPTALSKTDMEEPEHADDSEKKQDPFDAHSGLNSDKDESQSDAENVRPPTLDVIIKGEEEKDEDDEKYPERNRSDKRVDSTLEVLDRLTGQPSPDDTILFALPFCAPYSAISKYKFKAKLIPGTQKRGKIGRLAIHHFSVDPQATPLEQQLLKSIKEEDICRVFPGSAKITFPEATNRPT